MGNIRVIDLIPGELHLHPWTSKNASDPLPSFAVYIGQMPHPLFRSCQLVLWRLSDDTVSCDALDIRQVLPTQRIEVDPTRRLAHLRWALGIAGTPKPDLTRLRVRTN